MGFCQHGCFPELIIQKIGDWIISPLVPISHWLRVLPKHESLPIPFCYIPSPIAFCYSMQARGETCMLEKALGKNAERQLQVLPMKSWQGKKSLSFCSVSTTAVAELEESWINAMWAPGTFVSDEDNKARDTLFATDYHLMKISHSHHNDLKTIILCNIYVALWHVCVSQFPHKATVSIIFQS